MKYRLTLSTVEEVPGGLDITKRAETDLDLNAAAALVDCIMVGIDGLVADDEDPMGEDLEGPVRETMVRLIEAIEKTSSKRYGG